MDDYTGSLVGLGLIWGAAAACSIYEYHKCKRLILEDPTISPQDLVSQHGPIEKYTIYFLGLGGVEIARYKHQRERRDG